MDSTGTDEAEAAEAAAVVDGVNPAPAAADSPVSVDGVAMRSALEEDEEEEEAVGSGVPGKADGTASAGSAKDKRELVSDAEEEEEAGKDEDKVEEEDEEELCVTESGKGVPSENEGA